MALGSPSGEVKGVRQRIELGLTPSLATSSRLAYPRPFVKRKMWLSCPGPAAQSGGAATKQVGPSSARPGRTLFGPTVAAKCLLRNKNLRYRYAVALQRPAPALQNVSSLNRERRQ